MGVMAETLRHVCFHCPQNPDTLAEGKGAQ